MSKAIKSIAGVAAPIVGGIFGGPAGAAIGSAVGGLISGGEAQSAAQQAANQATDAENRALNYLMATERLPQELREGALKNLGGLYGLGGMNPDEALGKITGSAAYKNVLGSRAAGEEAILRNAAATGGLRSGNVQDALAGYNIELQQEAFNQGLAGLTGLAGLNTNTAGIASQMSNVGKTAAQGTLGVGQTQQDTLGGLIGAGANIYGLGAKQGWWSDARLKENVKPAGTKNGLPWYTWEWSKEAEELGLFGNDEGVMAHEIAELKPEAVRVVDKYLTVDYSALGV